MSDGTLDDRYFDWLYKKIGSLRNRNPAKSYWNLARQLHSTPFYWFVHNDDNRCEDGKELRYEFLSETGNEPTDISWLALDCSMLEMLIALARRACFESRGTTGDWFWQFMFNMNLDKYTDAVYNEPAKEDIQDRLERIVQRKYGEDGNGGIFPLRLSRYDQRRVELWYQMSAYLLEGEFVDHGPKRL